MHASTECIHITHSTKLGQIYILRRIGRFRFAIRHFFMEIILFCHFIHIHVKAIRGMHTSTCINNYEAFVSVFAQNIAFKFVIIFLCRFIAVNFYHSVNRFSGAKCQHLYCDWFQTLNRQNTFVQAAFRFKCSFFPFARQPLRQRV